MVRFWVAASLVACLAGCGSGDSAKVTALEKRITELDEQVWKHHKIIEAHGKVLTRMQADEIGEIKAQNRALEDKLGKTNEEIRRLENN